MIFELSRYMMTITAYKFSWKNSCDERHPLKKNTDKGYHNRMNIFKIIYNHNVCALKWLKTQNATCILARHLQVLGNALLVTEEQKKIRWHLSCTLKVWMVGTWKEICMSTCVWEKDHSYVEFQFVHLPSILSESMNCIS